MNCLEPSTKCKQKTNVQITARDNHASILSHITMYEASKLLNLIVIQRLPGESKNK